MQKITKNLKIMAIEQAKVLAALSTKFKGKSLSKTFLQKTATRYAAKIETEADLDDYINDREEDILAAGEEADRRVTAATKKLSADKGESTKKTETEVEIDEDELKDAPPYVKVLMKSLEGMKSEITTLKAEKTASTIEKRFLEDPRLKGINSKLLKGRIPKTDDEFETAIEEAVEDLKEFIVAEKGDGKSGKTLFSTDRPGFSGKAAGAGSTQTEKVPDAISKFTAGLNKSSQNSNAVKN